MSQTQKEKTGTGFLGWLSDALPNCRSAITLAERGIEKPLNAVEKLALAYHKPLCPFCACNRNKFQSLLRKYESTEASRKP